MKRLLTIILLSILSCLGLAAQQKVMARFVPERADDFVWENELIAYRAYGKALEGNPTSPGFDVWVKLPGKLVADDWYAHSKTNPGYYHHNHGGKDCYKVAVSLGAGASAVITGGDKINYPATNYRKWKIFEQTDDKVVFVLTYPSWKVGEVDVALSKKITVEAGSYFCKCEDVYTFTGAQTLDVAAGVFRHKPGTIEEEYSSSGVYAIWEQASDQSVEKEDGRIGVGIIVPGAAGVTITEDGLHGLLGRTVRSGETFTYYFGSCWSKGDLSTSKLWFKTVKKAAKAVR